MLIFHFNYFIIHSIKYLYKTLIFHHLQLQNIWKLLLIIVGASVFNLFMKWLLSLLLVNFRTICMLKCKVKCGVSTHYYLDYSIPCVFTTPSERSPFHISHVIDCFAMKSAICNSHVKPMEPPSWKGVCLTYTWPTWEKPWANLGNKRRIHV